jgi:thioesterase domain-containing protein
MEENNIVVDTIKLLIPEDLTWIIPNYNQIGTRDLIYYLNMHRTLTSALLLYLPGRPIDTTIHYFKASRSPEAVKEGWHDYCKKPLEIHQLDSDHFSILKKPTVDRMGKIFTDVFTAYYWNVKEIK